MKLLHWIAFLACSLLNAHNPITTKVTFNREIVRILHENCVSCHRAEGTAFSLMTYPDARPWAKAIEEEVLERRMPPWGAVKGYGHFRNDRSLTMTQMQSITDWVEGGAPEGEPADLPASVNVPDEQGAIQSGREVMVSGETKLSRALALDGLHPRSAPERASLRITAELPDGTMVPLLWLYNYTEKFGHAFLLKTPVQLPAGTLIRGVPRGARVELLPARP